MTETKVFVSSCSRRELTLRRRSHSWLTLGGVSGTHLALTALAFIVVCGGAFIAGRGGF